MIQLVVKICECYAAGLDNRFQNSVASLDRLDRGIVAVCHTIVNDSYA
ncbi:hypothetical protein HSR122_2577 [Halapricum desulfuricans]|uniref:Uncharacterized protein n=1 Tax=Halapricum desulfuricans TaxID=2841257 RepID=A0A897NG40_9EURY|nr:hypothetical protein HSR122_2577 [Halapricum desulfuricans]